MEEDFERLKKNSSSWGGARDNAGRPKGSENEETKKRRVVEEEFKQRVLRSADELINSQMSLAKGVQMLYCIEKDGNKNKKPRLVEDQKEIEEYLEGNYCDNKNYYFITTERPDNRAIDSLFDRVFGKAIQPSVDLTKKEEPDIKKIFNELKQKAKEDDEKNNTTINEQPA